MQLPRPNAGLSKFGQCVLTALLLSNVLVDAIALPIHNDRLQHRDLASTSAPLAVRLTPLKPKPKPAGDPVPGPPSQHTNPVDSNPPPPLHNSGPDPVAPGAQPDRLVPPTPEQPKPIANPKPDPNGPVPTEAEIATLYSVPKDKSIFWSGTKDQVAKYRAEAGLVSDSRAFPPGYSKTFRGVDRAKDDEFARRFSRVFAKGAQGEVRLMVPWEAGPNPTRVFHQDEWPILKEGLQTGRITKIIQVNPNNFAETRIYDPSLYGLSRRAAEIDMGNVPWDVDLDALAEAWNRAARK